jgi:predicted Fe-Mo cluster-binding NifX family protein
MRICFPVEGDQGLDSTVSEHFGHVPAFVVVDSETMEATTIHNTARGGGHGGCAPVELLGGHDVDAVVVAGIGRGAIARLASTGTRVYRAVPGSVRHNVEQLAAGELPEFSDEWTCAGHGRHAGGPCH